VSDKPAGDPRYDLLKHLTEVTAPHVPPGHVVVLLVMSPEGEITFSGNAPRVTIGGMALAVAERVADEPRAGDQWAFLVRRRGRG
jgi:hypothetical protein